MSQITRVCVTVGGTFNIGNYESIRLECAVESIIQPSENVSKRILELQEYASEQVNGPLLEAEMDARGR